MRTWDLIYQAPRAHDHEAGPATARPSGLRVGTEGISGSAPDVRGAAVADPSAMPVFVLQHQHEPHECAAAFAAWAGFESPLRHRTVESSCLTGGHALWWRVQSPDQASALAHLPQYVAERTTAIEIRQIHVP